MTAGQRGHLHVTGLLLEAELVVELVGDLDPGLAVLAPLGAVVGGVAVDGAVAVEVGVGVFAVALDAAAPVALRHVTEHRLTDGAGVAALSAGAGVHVVSLGVPRRAIAVATFPLGALGAVRGAAHRLVARSRLAATWAALSAARASVASVSTLPCHGTNTFFTTSAWEPSL